MAVTGGSYKLFLSGYFGVFPMLLIAFAAAVVQAPLPMQWAQFSRSGALSHISETVDVATGDRKGINQFQYKLRLTRKALGAEAETKWADSLSCPAMRAVIASMRDIAVPSPAPYGVPGETMEMTLDGTGYFLSAPSSYNMGRITLSSNIGSPLAKWIDGSFKRLAPCWTAVEPDASSGSR